MPLPLFPDEDDVRQFAKMNLNICFRYVLFMRLILMRQDSFVHLGLACFGRFPCWRRWGLWCVVDGPVSLEGFGTFRFVIVAPGGQLLALGSSFGAGWGYPNVWLLPAGFVDCLKIRRLWLASSTGPYWDWRQGLNQYPVTSTPGPWSSGEPCRLHGTAAQNCAGHLIVEKLNDTQSFRLRKAHESVTTFSSRHDILLACLCIF